jgi:Toprim domain
MSIAARIAEAIAKKRVTARGDNYLVRCPAHDDASPSLSLRDGDNGALVVHCFAGCSPSDVFVAIRRIDRGLLQPGQTAREAPKGSTEYERQQHETAAWLWSQRKPMIGSIAERYLRDVRGITCALPKTLAFLPARKREHHPAMIAAFALVDELEPGVVSMPKDVGSVHLTLLRPDGNGKAQVERGKPDKLIIGSPSIKIDDDDVRGLPIVLAPPNDLLGLAICEGIEDALTAHQATGLGAWAAGAAGFMPKLAKMVPSYIEAVTIFAHPDNAGVESAHRLAAALSKRRIEIRMEGL